MRQEASPNPSRLRPLRGLRIGLLLILLPGLGCKQPVQPGPVEVRIYDLSGNKLLLCDLSGSNRSRNQGFIKSKSTGGEQFRGEWIRLNQVKDSSQTPSSIYPSSIPAINSQINPMSQAWSWAAEFGIDFKNFPDTYFSFMLYGDAGTLITGFFLNNASAGNGMIQNLLSGAYLSRQPPGNGLLGAAKDNKGHRYKLMG
ncbi:MAG: hypothetical protein P4L36_19600 [Holophaga sp.]|nr:hypothetical protein [Holophaga sp.]